MVRERSPLTVESKIERAARFLTRNRISAVYVSGPSKAGYYEGISLVRRGEEVGCVRVVDGKLASDDFEEFESQQMIPGFVKEVIEPLEVAAAAATNTGLDLMEDKRFDTLPGFART